MGTTEGIIYIATANNVIRSTKTFLQEAEESAQSVKEHSDISITLITDQPAKAGEVFTNVIEIPNPDFGWRDKIKCLKLSPYDKTLFLDTDTRVINSIESVFHLLDGCSLAVAHDPSHGEHHHPDVPKSFPEFNTGVLAYNNTNEIVDFLNDWLDNFDNENKDWISGDQPAFRKTLYKSNIKFTTLTREWNVRYTHPGMLAGPPRILHGRIPHPKRIKKSLQPGSVYFRSWFSVRTYKPRKHIPYYLNILYSKLRRDGLYQTLSSILKRL